MNIFARFSKNKVRAMENDVINLNHKRICNCRECKKQRRKDIKVSCAFLFPLIGLMALISALF